MRVIRSIVVGGLLLLVAGTARAQGAGVRAGVSGQPDQFYVGAHYESDELADHIRFRPNLEVGTGNGLTLTALNFELVYRTPFRRSEWSIYGGGGPALLIYRSSNRSASEGGFNILIGLAHRRGLFTELKVGAIDSPDVKFAVGYTFHK